MTIQTDAVDIAMLSATGTASPTTFLRGDNSWQVVSSPLLDSPSITGTLSVDNGGNVSHTIANWSDDITYVITPTNCTVGSVNSSGIFVVTHTSGSPSYTIKATTDSLGLDDSALVTKNLLMNLLAPTLSSPADEHTLTDVVYTITSTDTGDDKIILDIGSSNFTFQSVSIGSASKVGNTVVCTGFTTNNPAVTIQFTAEATYSVTAKSINIAGTYGDSASSSADSLTIANSSGYIVATGPDSAAGVISGDYRYHKFTATKTGSAGFVVSDAGTTAGNIHMEYMIVAGGGGSAADLGSGAGAGGYRSFTGTTVAVQNYDITVGGGGAGTTGSSTHGVKGSNTSAFSTTTTGGGRGIYECQTASINGEGGSGSGQSNCTRTASSGNEGGYSPVEGYGGGNGNDPGGGGRAGGGGGAGGTGGNANGSNAGVGGVGRNDHSAWATILSAGDSGYFAGGGAGGCGGSGHNTGAVSGGQGGGGDRSSASGTSGSNGGSGTINTGGGGAGGASLDGSGYGGSGGSGIVMIRYKFQN
jgi:hypothetical protein